MNQHYTSPTQRVDLVQSRHHFIIQFHQSLTDFVCLYNYEFWLSLWKIVRSSVILLLPLLFSPLYSDTFLDPPSSGTFKAKILKSQIIKKIWKQEYWILNRNTEYWIAWGRRTLVLIINIYLINHVSLETLNTEWMILRDISHCVMG
jgi:hypothetical protein